MTDIILKECLGVVLAPLVASLIAGLMGKAIGRKASHTITIAGVAISFVLSVIIFKQVLALDEAIDVTVYRWATSGAWNFQVGFMIDRLSALMMMVVTFVSWMVHIYTIGYMQEDPGYQRFFSYISLFTFAMLMLVMSNNFMQLFFGWEAVGLVSYLLIGFWFKKESAIFANLKAFLVNRLGDFGFILGIGGILVLFNSLDYATVFKLVPSIADSQPVFHLTSSWSVSAITATCILLFIGAMGKSAQVPLHVWLPDSMEGPTPISALIHAATMVTAGVFMVTRFSPIFEYSDVALNFILVIGASTAFFMGLIGVVSNDIKRIIAYSTLSQLGYMMTAVGSSAYSAAMFHLMTHAFFKALLFLGAGAVIIAMHHEQDIRKMGGLKRYIPITYWCMVVGTIAIIGVPLFSGFYSKDTIIEAVKLGNLPASKFAYYAVLSGVFVTALYSFRLLFLVFHGEDRMDMKTKSHVHEPPAVVWGPLVALAIPSIFAGAVFVGPMFKGFFKEAVFVLPTHTGFAELASSYHGIFAMALHGIMMPPFWLLVAGFVTAWVCYIKFPHIPTIKRGRKFFLLRIFKDLRAIGLKKRDAKKILNAATWLDENNSLPSDANIPLFINMNELPQMIARTINNIHDKSLSPILVLVGAKVSILIKN